MNFLDTIIARKQAAVESAKGRISFEKLVGLTNGVKPRNNFKIAIARGWNDPVRIIAEIKRASPSKGAIAEDIDAAQVARDYKSGGASAISVLTENNFFKGSDKDLQCVREAVQDVPVLRKDFIIDEYQIYESVQMGADAILLIVAAFAAGQAGASEKMLKKFIATARQCGLSSLVEVHDENELDAALSAGAEIIGVNNRNLVTFEVSPEVSEKLAQNIRTKQSFRGKEIVTVSESGIHDLNALRTASDGGYHAVLIGEHFMRAKDRAAEVRKFSDAIDNSKFENQNSKVV